MDQAQALSEYQRYVRQNPADAEGARKSFFDTFGVDPNAPKTAFQKQAAQRKASIGVEQTRAGYETDLANAKAGFVKDLASTIPVAATLATGGMAAPLAVGTMAGAGGIAGAYGEAAKLAFGSADAATSMKDLARRLGVDTALSATVETGARLAGPLLAMSGKAITPLVARAAAKSDAGKTILEDFGTRMMNKLRLAESGANAARPPSEPGLVVAGDVTAAPSKIRLNIDDELGRLEARLASRTTGVSEALKERLPKLLTRITHWDQSISGLTEIKGELSQFAHKGVALNYEERNAMKKFAEEIDNKLTRAWGRIGEAETYSAFKETANQLHRFSGGIDMAERVLRNFAHRAGYGIIGGAAGGGYGYGRGGMSGALQGAAAGAALGTAVSFLDQRGAPWLLSHLLSDKTTAPAVKVAMDKMMVGDSKEAMKIFTRAVAQSGLNEPIKVWMKNEVSEEPNAAGEGQK